MELTSLVEEDNKDGCDEYFWSTPIGNPDETKGLSKMTSWKTKSRYVTEPLNKVNSSYEGSPNGNKKVPSDASSVQTETPLSKPKSRANIHKSSEQFASQKRQRNERYNKNIKERKNFWRTKNPNFVY